MSDLKVTYPVPIDSNHSAWDAFRNEYWPADYFIDAKGRIRYHPFGGGEYEKSERVIQTLLKENGATGLDESPVKITADGSEAPSSEDIRSPETYAGCARTENLASPERMARLAKDLQPPGKIVFRFHRRDLHMVLGPAKNGTPVRFKVKLNGAAPGSDHGSDSAADGKGEVR